jgi:hypothetical protein
MSCIEVGVENTLLIPIFRCQFKLFINDFPAVGDVGTSYTRKQTGKQIKSNQSIQSVR